MKKATTKTKTYRLKYRVIRNHDQYCRYCMMLNKLLEKKDRRYRHEIEMLELLTAKWEEHQMLQMDPIEVLKFWGEAIPVSQFAKELGISKSHMSDLLNYKKPLSRKLIQRLSAHFRSPEHWLGRPYSLGKKTKWIVPYSQIEW